MAAKRPTKAESAKVCGYKNFATWSIIAWLDNDYKTYKAARLFKAGLRGEKWTKFAIEEWVKKRVMTYPDDLTRSIRRNGYSEVSWSEISEHLNYV
jgi:DNA-binding transcriptional ArsR family regulator